MSDRSPEPLDESALEPDLAALPATAIGRGVVIALLVALTAAVAGAVATGMYANSLSAQLDTAHTQLRAQNTTRVQAPTQVQQYRLRPQSAKPVQPSLMLNWPMPPQLLDLLVDLSESSATQFQLTLDRTDGVRILQLQRLTRDSNKDLRLSLNSSAFGPGEYLLRIDSYDWRGRASELGWLRLSLQ